MPPVINLGRIVNNISGISGVTAGGNAIINLPTNQRYHRLVLQCGAVNYTGGTALPAVNITGTGINATITPTIVNGVVTAAVVVAAGTGYVVGDTFNFVDATGTGVVLRVATVSSGAMATIGVTSGGSASPIDPRTLLSSIKLLVNGVNMRDISPDSILRISNANNLYSRLGEFAIYFTAPWRNVNQANELTSWDLFGQSTFQVQFGISSSVSSPYLVGLMEFDYQRNVQTDGAGKTVPMLQPVAQHQFSFPIVAGRNDINTLPYSFPISRMWLLGSTAAQLTQIAVLQDSNRVFEALLSPQNQLAQMYEEYGFQFGRPDYINQNGTVANVKSNILAPFYFDAAFISDPDQRWFKALKVQNQMILQVYSAIAQTLTVVIESLPGQYTS